MTKADILIIEDSETDSVLIQEAIKQTVMANSVYAVSEPDEALRFLNNKGDFIDVPKPDLIIMDLNMPNIDGHEFLKLIKGDRRFSYIPIIVLSGSDKADDIAESYRLHANCYIVKPTNFVKFKSVVGVINDFWLGIARLSPKN